MRLKNCFIQATFATFMLAGVQYVNAQITTLKGNNLPYKEIDDFIRRQMDSLNIPALSLAIIQKGKIVYYIATGVKNKKGNP